MDTKALTCPYCENVFSTEEGDRVCPKCNVRVMLPNQLRLCAILGGAMIGGFVGLLVALIGVWSWGLLIFGEAFFSGKGIENARDWARIGMLYGFPLLCVLIGAFGAGHGLAFQTKNRIK